MDIIATLGTLTGLAFLSGIRLYSTVLAVGFGIRLGFIQLPDHLASLHVLAATPILAIAGAVYLIEFLADKIPWVDSLWDAFHTFVRPIGAAILGGIGIGDVDPALKMAAILLCGTVALTSHSAKAGTRLAVNHSPEPFSNIGLSLGEDALVAGGAWFIFAHPVIAAVLVVICVGIIIWLVPKLVRLFRRNLARLGSFIRGESGQAREAT